MSVDASALCLDLARPSHVLARAEMESCRRLCEASKLWLRQRALQWISSRTQEPILQRSSAECTPINTRPIHNKLYEHMRVTRHGRHTAEYLVQRVFLMPTDRQPIPGFVIPSR